jgi:hypothetical protein
MNYFISISFFLILGFSSCKEKGESNKFVDKKEKVNMSIENFIGSWELKEWYAELSNGETVYPFGEDALGRISYDGFGNMAVQIMQNNRSHFLSEDPLQAQPDEVIDAYNGFIAYCGNYEVDLNHHQVIHQIKISSFPNWVGQNQVRFFEFKDNKLILSTDIIGSSRHTLIWEKMKK